ncbi:MAG: YghX family hydrolase [Alphaproteobacteria bacterium]
MARRKASDFDQGLLDLFDGLVHGRLSRREFLDRAAVYAVGGVTAAGLLEALSPQYALAQQVDPNDPRIRAEFVEYSSPDGHGTVRGLLARPADASGPVPGVVVVHENRGLNPYIEDVARRVAVAGFMALAPDGLTPLGGYPGTDAEGREMQRRLDGAKLLEDFVAAFADLRARDDTTDKIGAVGFCYGGGVVNAMVVRLPELAAAVPFYGPQPATEDVPKIQAPLLIHYAGNDNYINPGWPDYEAALKANGKEFTAHFYPDTNHGFHNDTTPRYDEAAAKLAWDRTIAFFNEKLT